MRKCTTVTMLIGLLVCGWRTANAQDRPLLEPFRIAYVQSEPVAGQLSQSSSFAHSLRRKGQLGAWQPFTNGIDALQALTSGRADLVLNATLEDVVGATESNNPVIFVAEIQSASSSCDMLFCHLTQRRYILSSEYLANSRDDVLSAILREAFNASQLYDFGRVTAALGPIPVSYREPRALKSVATVTRASLLKAADEASMNADLFSNASYWSP